MNGWTSPEGLGVLAVLAMPALMAGLFYSYVALARVAVYVGGQP